jgi:hypothetical protein
MAGIPNYIQEEADLDNLEKIPLNDPIQPGDVVYTFQNAYGVKGFVEGVVLEVLPGNKVKVQDKEGLNRDQPLNRVRSILYRKKAAPGAAQNQAEDVEMAMGGRKRRNRKTRARKTKRRKTLRRK